MDCFDADVLVYAAVRGHPLGRRVAALLSDDRERIGSVLLIPEVLGKPLRDDAADEVRALSATLACLDLRMLDRNTASLAAVLAGKYRLRAADATHLATAVAAGSDRFVTNNQRDFTKSIAEVDVVYPDELPDPQTS